MALPSADRKLFLGARLKRLRRELGLTQTRMAEDLGVSPSYLNLLERNQRPVTAQVLLRLAEAYDLDLKTLSAEPQEFAWAARERLAKAHGVQVRVVPVEVLPESVRRFDHHRKRLFLSEALSGEGRAFSIAYQLALLEQRDLLDRLAERANPPDR